MFQHFYKSLAFQFRSVFSMLFDGNNESINIDNTLPALINTTKGTLSAYAKKTGTVTAGNHQLISFGDTNASEFIFIAIRDDDKVRADCVINSTLQWRLETDNAATTEDEWSRITLIQDGTEPRILVDGTEVAQSFSGSGADKTAWFSDTDSLDNGRIGALLHNDSEESQHFKGNIDEVLIFNTDISNAEENEISSNVDANNHSKSANLVYYNRMGDDEGSRDLHQHEDRHHRLRNAISNSRDNRKSVNFDGVDETIEFPHSSVYNFARDDTFSISFWVKTTTTGADFICSKQESSGAIPGWAVFFEGNASNRLRFRLVANNGTGDRIIARNDTPLNDGLWHHVVVTYSGNSDPSGVNFYIDGGSAESTNVVNDTLSGDTTNNEKLYVSSFANSALFFVGNIDELLITNDEKTQSEASDIYNKGAPKDESNISNGVAYWFLDDINPTDQIGSNDGTNVNLESADAVRSTINYSTSVGMPLKDPNDDYLVYDGVDEYSQLDSETGFDFGVSDSFSFECVIKSFNAEDISNNTGLFSKRNTGVGYIFLMNNNSDPSLLMQDTSGNTLRVETSDTISNNVYYHVIITYDGSSNASGVNIYMNGESKSLITVSDTLSLASNIKNNLVPAVNANPNGAGKLYNGIINNIIVWDKELNQTEVDEAYNDGDVTDPESRSYSNNGVGGWEGKNATLSGGEFTVSDTFGNNDLTTVKMEDGDKQKSGREKDVS